MFGNGLKGSLRLCSDLRILAKEDIADGILTRWRKFKILVMLKFTLHEFVGDGCHDTGSITVTAVGTDGTSMGHIAQQTASLEISGWQIKTIGTICDNLVANFALDMAENQLAGLTKIYGKRAWKLTK